LKVTFLKPTSARSANMRAIKGHSNASTEWRFRSLLMRKSIQGWQLTNRDLPGNPDFYFRRFALAVFIDGCFWHSCPSCGHLPKTNGQYWREKLRRNRIRDRAVTRVLKSQGIGVLRIWECSLKSHPERQFKNLLARLESKR
jgi:DNA mismatch endonuclease, patch repair protein